MKVYQSRSFEQKIKKLTRQEKEFLDQEIHRIIDNPLIGEGKKGDLQGVFVHKFKLSSTLYLLAYCLDSDALELIMIGPHENYYRDLKQYLKNR